MFVVAVDQGVCDGCGECTESCPSETLKLVDGKAQVVNDECMGCETCVTICPTGAVTLQEV
ncbi:indolepyruvate ferredoxin oxidoreductase subunit alpha [Candidatus Desulforudis audaxviator]|uniref:4Fe-4S ferredoxin, iron-sulfur binding domain protein n=1 Tax=Desulforudis audaxviator (strain MP104C) TaxID=477974 RepID=B1I6N2_DESAP|nr:4Fe-4S binding protein [Candidatus Desulforudis audaxviator]ACA60680.1 4Fe-4S ferredoxin, iron-sulfur binding domain protein [Candidatus Desulforudis audaxviator MP104C]AZK60763.1 4Fe-4S ferredoxin, iron-sulfur binding domain protein [Candidatus Desulforudis audaxviator]